MQKQPTSANQAASTTGAAGETKVISSAPVSSTKTENTVATNASNSNSNATKPKNAVDSQPVSTKSPTAAQTTGAKSSNDKGNSGSGSGSGNAVGHYILGKALGEGTFGKVKLGTHILTGEKVAVKVLEKSKIKDKKDVERISREIKILKQLHHPNVVQIYEIIETEKDLFLVMEFASGGELFDMIVQNQKLKEKTASKYFQELIAGVYYIHKLGICHRDLKPENLLIDFDGQLKVVDFGLSNMYTPGQTLKTACGSPCYAAPEMIAGNKYHGLKSDIWSCGVVLYAMLCGYLPFEDQKTSNLYKKILGAEYSLPKFLSPEAKDFIAKIFVTDPEKRIDIEGMKQHPWYKLAQPENKNYNYHTMKRTVNAKLVSKMEAQLGFSKESVERAVQNNKHNHLSATYYLLLKKYAAQAYKLQGTQPSSEAHAQSTSAKAYKSVQPQLDLKKQFTSKNRPVSSNTNNPSESKNTSHQAQAKYSKLKTRKGPNGAEDSHIGAPIQDPLVLKNHRREQSANATAGRHNRNSDWGPPDDERRTESYGRPANEDEYEIVGGATAGAAAKSRRHGRQADEQRNSVPIRSQFVSPSPDPVAHQSTQPRRKNSTAHQGYQPSSKDDKNSSVVIHNVKNQYNTVSAQKNSSHGHRSHNHSNAAAHRQSTEGKSTSFAQQYKSSGATQNTGALSHHRKAKSIQSTGVNAHSSQNGQATRNSDKPNSQSLSQTQKVTSHKAAESVALQHQRPSSSTRATPGVQKMEQASNIANLMNNLNLMTQKSYFDSIVNKQTAGTGKDQQQQPHSQTQSSIPDKHQSSIATKQQQMMQSTVEHTIESALGHHNTSKGGTREKENSSAARQHQPAKPRHHQNMSILSDKELYNNGKQTVDNQSKSKKKSVSQIENLQTNKSSFYGTQPIISHVTTNTGAGQPVTFTGAQINLIPNLQPVLSKQQTSGSSKTPSRAQQTSSGLNVARPDSTQRTVTQSKGSSSTKHNRGVSNILTTGNAKQPQIIHSSAIASSQQPSSSGHHHNKTQVLHSAGLNGYLIPNSTTSSQHVHREIPQTQTSSTHGSRVQSSKNVSSKSQTNQFSIDQMLALNSQPMSASTTQQIASQLSNSQTRQKAASTSYTPATQRKSSMQHTHSSSVHQSSKAGNSHKERRSSYTGSYSQPTAASTNKQHRASSQTNQNSFLLRSFDQKNNNQTSLQTTQKTANSIEKQFYNSMTIQQQASGTGNTQGTAAMYSGKGAGFAGLGLDDNIHIANTNAINSSGPTSSTSATNYQKRKQGGSILNQTSQGTLGKSVAGREELLNPGVSSSLNANFFQGSSSNHHTGKKKAVAVTDLGIDVQALYKQYHGSSSKVSQPVSQSTSNQQTKKNSIGSSVTGTRIQNDLAVNKHQQSFSNSIGHSNALNEFFKKTFNNAKGAGTDSLSMTQPTGGKRCNTQTSKHVFSPERAKSTNKAIPNNGEVLQNSTSRAHSHNQRSSTVTSTTNKAIQDQINLMQQYSSQLNGGVHPQNYSSVASNGGKQSTMQNYLSAHHQIVPGSSGVSNSLQQYISATLGVHNTNNNMQPGSQIGYQNHHHQIPFQQQQPQQSLQGVVPSASSTTSNQSKGGKANAQAFSYAPHHANSVTMSAAGYPQQPQSQPMHNSFQQVPGGGGASQGPQGGYSLYSTQPVHQNFMPSQPQPHFNNTVSMQQQSSHQHQQHQLQLQLQQQQQQQHHQRAKSGSPNHYNANAVHQQLINNQKHQNRVAASGTRV